jgi:hypothetical protein
VFLEWRELREDESHPWGVLCDELAGRGVSSLEDALHGLRLRPVHQAFREITSVKLAEELAEIACMSDGPVKTRELEAILENVAVGVNVLLEQAQHYIASSGFAMTGLSLPVERWRPHPHVAREACLERLRAAVRLVSINRKAGLRWSSEARTTLPLDRPGSESPAVWSTILGWCATEALGCLCDPKHRETAAARLFDDLRLRQTLAESLDDAGLQGEEKWRAAARVRATFAHSLRSSAHYAWIHDPDVAWAMGVHQYEGFTYVVKEHFERLLCWMGLRGLLDAVSVQPSDPEKLAEIADEITSRAIAMEKAAYRVEALEDSDTIDVLHRSEEKSPEKI